MASRLTAQLQWVFNDAKLAPMKSASSFALLSAPQSTADAHPTTETPLPPREQAIYLLHIAAEVEHALMVQYLYAAFSLGGDQVPPDRQSIVQDWRKTILSVAREEMGHLTTVQNLLQLVGGPITFERSDFPIPSDLYPFDFSLQPLTREALAAYVLAEMPDEAVIQRANLTAEIDAIKQVAKWHTGGRPVHPVGAIYLQIDRLFGQMNSADFSAESVKFQAQPSEWGMGYDDLLILSALNRTQATAILNEIAEQGEGAAINTTADLDAKSHFMRFLVIYRAFPTDGSWTPSRPVAINPTLLPPVGKSQTAITNPVARQWAILGNLRYRMLLSYLLHSFFLEGDGAPGSPRGLLVANAFAEMYHLRSIGDILASMRISPSGKRLAGLPFEMPYTLALPDREPDRWRSHRDLLLACGMQTAQILKQSGTYSSYLNAAKAMDEEFLKTIAKIIGN